MSFCASLKIYFISKVYVCDTCGDFKFLGLKNLIPSSQFKYVGQTAYFDCITAASTKWLFQGGPLPNNAASSKYIKSNGVHVDRLIITSVTLDNRGKYICIIGNDLYEAEGVLDVLCE